MYADIIAELFDRLCEFLYTIWLLVIEIVYDLHYRSKPKVSVSQPPKSGTIEKSAKQIHQDIIEGRVTCAQVVEDFIQRTHEVNPIVNGMCYDNFAEARKEAKQVDELLSGKDNDERKQLSTEKPLLGVPFTVKNNISAKGFATCNGLTAWKDNIEKEDAECVKSLRNVGGIVLAVTNVPEFCMWIETSNALFGRTSNPYDIRRTGGGSSGGEGVLIASGASVLGIGTDVAGSIRVPSMFCGIYGIKPTPKVMSCEGFRPEERDVRLSLLQIPGPMCRYSVDLYDSFKAMCYPEEFAKMAPAKEIQDLKFFSFHGMKGWSHEKTSTDQKEAFNKVLGYLEDKHGKMAPPVDVPHQREMLAFLRTLIQSGLDRPYCDITGGTKTPVEFVTEAVKCLLLGDKNTKFSKNSLQCNVNSMLFHGVDLAEQEKIMQVVDRAQKMMNALLGDNGIIIMPGWPTAAVHHEKTVLKHTGIATTAMWNILGLPAIAVPLGLGSEGLPLSVQIIGAPYSDLTLLRLAEVFDGHNPRCDAPQLFPGFVAPWKV